MSTILEALKKSEQERKLNNVPTLSNMATPQESSRWPLIGFAVLALILLAVLIIMAASWFSAQDVSQTNSPNSLAPRIVTNETVNADVVESQNESANSNEVVVNVVSYSKQAEQRFVMINGKMFREGEFVRGGLKVEKINPDEVILNSRGRRIVRKP